MIIKNFYVDGADYVVDVEALNSPPVELVFLDHLSNSASATVPTSQVGNVYTYRVGMSETEGVHNVTITHLVDDDAVATICILDPLVTFLAHKTLLNEFDCLLLQEIYAVKEYTKSGNFGPASEVYVRALNKTHLCTTDYTPEIVNSSYVIINEVLTEV